MECYATRRRFWRESRILYFLTEGVMKRAVKWTSTSVDRRPGRQTLEKGRLMSTTRKRQDRSSKKLHGHQILYNGYHYTICLFEANTHCFCSMIGPIWNTGLTGDIDYMVNMVNIKDTQIWKYPNYVAISNYLCSKQPLSTCMLWKVRKWLFSTWWTSTGCLFQLSN